MAAETAGCGARGHVAAQIRLRVCLVHLCIPANQLLPMKVSQQTIYVNKLLFEINVLMSISNVIS